MNATRQMIGAVILSTVVAASVAVGQTGMTELPFSEDFTGGTWQTVWATNNASYVPGSGAPVGGFLTIAEANDVPASLSLTNKLADTKNIWWRGFAKVSPSAEGSVPDETDVAGSAAAFFVAQVGTGMKLFAFSGGPTASDVQELMTFPSLANPTNTWIGYAVRLDYNNQLWDLYTSTSQDLNGTMTKANTAGPLAFVDNSLTALDSFNVKYETSLAAVMIFQAGGSVSADSPATITPRTIDKTAGNWVASRVADKDYTGRNRLDQELGTALAAGLVPGDRIRIHDEDGWQAFELNTAGVWASVSPGIKTPDQIALNAGDPIWFEYTNTITGVFTFLDPAWVPAELGKPVSNPPTSIGLNSNLAGSGGWTSMHWGMGQRNITQTSFSATLAAGTVVVVIDPATGTFVRGFWNAITEVWETVGGQSIILKPNYKVWFYRPLGDNDPLTWNL